MWLKLELYILSLWILFFLVFVNTVPVCFDTGCQFVGWKAVFTTHVVPTASALMTVLGFAFYRHFVYRVVEGAPRNPKKVVAVENLNFETLSFLVTYIVPLVCFNLDPSAAGHRSAVLIVLVLVLMGWIYVKANMFYQNPTLAVLGFNIYRVTSEGTDPMVIIIKGRLKKNDQIYTRLIDENIHFAKRAV